MTAIAQLPQVCAAPSAGSGAELRASELSDFELLQDYALHKSQWAFELLYDRGKDFVFKICRDSLHDEQLAEDATQKVFSALAAKAKSLKAGPLEGCLATLAMRICDKMFEAQRTWPRHKERYREETRIRHVENCPDVRLEKLDQLLPELDPQHREILDLHYQGHLAADEIAIKTGRTLSAVQKRLWRAVHAMRQRLDLENVEKECAGLIRVLRSLAKDPVYMLTLRIKRGIDRGMDVGHLLDELARLAPCPPDLDRRLSFIWPDRRAQRAAGGDLSKLDPQVRDRILRGRDLDRQLLESRKEERDERRRQRAMTAEK